MKIGPPGTNRAGMNEEQDPRGRQVLHDARNKHIVPIISDSSLSETDVAEDDMVEHRLLRCPGGERGELGGWPETKGATGMMGTRWMPWRWTPMKDVATRRNALGRRWQPVIQRSPNGATQQA